MALLAYGPNQCWTQGTADCFGEAFGLTGEEMNMNLAPALGGCQTEEIGCLVQACK